MSNKMFDVIVYFKIKFICHKGIVVQNFNIYKMSITKIKTLRYIRGNILTYRNLNEDRDGPY